MAKIYEGEIPPQLRDMLLAEWYAQEFIDKIYMLFVIKKPDSDGYRRVMITKEKAHTQPPQQV